MKPSTDTKDMVSDHSSNESLVETKINELVKKSELTKLDIRSLVVRCSSCGSQINHVTNKQSVKKHRKLGVITCKDCYEFYGSSEFSQDDSGYNYCTWCGNGGKLTVCDFCPNGFCGACIRRNFGRAEISETLKEGWKCYCCNSSRLKAKQNFCNILMDENNYLVKKEKKTEKDLNPTFNEAWLQAVFDDAEGSCKNFHYKLKRLKNIGVARSKSMKHVVMKVEQVITNHKRELKSFVKKMSEQYFKYIEQEGAKKSQITSNSGADSDINEVPVEDNSIRVDAEEKVPIVSPDDDCVVIEKSSIIVCTPDIDIPAVSSPVPENKKNNVDEANNAVDETTQAKLSLLLSSSESNSSKESSHDDSSSLKKSVRKEKQNSCDRNIPITERTLKVEISRCDHLFKNGEMSVKVNDAEDDEEDKLDKLVDNLCKDDPKKKITFEKSKNNTFGRKFRAAPKEKESSSSISLSSDDGEFQQPEKKNDLQKSSILKAKADLMESDSSSSAFSPGGGEEEEEKKKKEKPKSLKKETTDSSDDFLPNKKKRKYDKLLDGPLLSDEEKSKDKETKKRGKQKMSKKRRIMSSDEEGQKKENASSSSSSSTSDSDEELRKKARTPRKRRRAKAMDEGDSSDQEPMDASQGKGRKNIQKIISEKKLDKSTKEAQLEEKERKKRIEDRQRLYNKIVDTSADGKEIITRKMVLEVDQDSKEEIVEIHPDLVCKLKPHQVNGVKFMWECTIESVKDLNKPGSGCILAHCMGLGKSLQVISFLHTCLNNPTVKQVIKRAMVICPYNTCLNWASEFDFWLHDVDGEIKVHQLTEVKSNLERYDIIKYWFEEGGVIILSYDIFRRLSNDKKIPKLKPREREALLKYFLDPGPDIVVCDEGHILKNETSAISKATAKLQTKRRIVLTGTPLQNNLTEYHCMLSFVKPKLLGTRKEFCNRFVHPITNGQYENSTEYDVKLMKKRIHILHKLLEGCVQRCDYLALTKFLPPKHEYVISVKLSEIQMKMYECYIDKLSSAKKEKTLGSTLFVDFNNLRCIWTHPYTCHTSYQRQEFKRMFKDDDDEDLSDFINDDTPSEKEAETGTDNSVEEVVKEYKTRSRGKEDDSDIEEVSSGGEEKKEWYHEFISEDDRFNIQLSGKIVLLLDILKECEAIGDKIIVFSQSLLALDAIEDILNICDSQPVSEEDKNRDVMGRWMKGVDYFRMDGTTNADFRKNYIHMFNDPSNPRARLFLISTRAGSLGTNLIGANRVIVFDTSWNPSHDVQAIFRVYRFGQTKPVYIYRFLAQGTMEEKIYDRQVTKLSLSCRVVDEQQIDRHFSAADLAELYTFDRNSTSNRPTPMVPKDRLLAEMLRKNKEWIVTYHEHDSLLQSQTEEDLTEEERQAAWTEYETEREGRVQFNTQPQMANGEFDAFCPEPDFSSEDYEGRKIPDLKNIIEHLYESIKKRMPGINNLEIKKRLLMSVVKVTQKYQEEHVKVLRMKQELIAHGTVPNTINKFLDELSNVIKSTSEYIRRLKETLKLEEDKIIQWQEQLRRMQQHDPQAYMRFVRPGQKTYIKVPANMFGNNVRYSFQQRPTAYNLNSFTSTNIPTASAPKEPTITEVEDDAATTIAAPPPNYSTNNKKSTVIIEEIP